MCFTCQVVSVLQREGQRKVVFCHARSGKVTEHFAVDTGRVTSGLDGQASAFRAFYQLAISFLEAFRSAFRDTFGQGVAYREPSVLLTVAGSHAISIYSKRGELLQELGAATQRGCSDGPPEGLRFWFPSSSEPFTVNESRPLLPGPHQRIFVHSGGVLMELLDKGARKVTAMREELWLMEKDEGTPEYPLAYGALGVHDNKASESLCIIDE